MALVGVDVFAGMLRVAKQRSPRIAWVNGDGAVLPLHSDSVDYACNQFSYHHLPVKEALVHEVWRVLKPGGRYVDQFAARVRALFSACPSGRERDIAEHACLKYSGRVGRSASAKALEEAAVRFAVLAHVRHRETPYDALFARGYDRGAARAAVEEAVRRVVQQWGAQP